LLLLNRSVSLLVFPQCAGSRNGEVAEPARVGLRENEFGARRRNRNWLLFYDRWLA
jgi:hypothetical protein